MDRSDKAMLLAAMIGIVAVYGFGYALFTDADFRSRVFGLVRSKPSGDALILIGLAVLASFLLVRTDAWCELGDFICTVRYQGYGALLGVAFCLAGIAIRMRPKI